MKILEHCIWSTFPKSNSSSWDLNLSPQDYYSSVYMYVTVLMKYREIFLCIMGKLWKLFHAPWNLRRLSHAPWGSTVNVPTYEGQKLDWKLDYAVYKKATLPCIQWWASYFFKVAALLYVLSLLVKEFSYF